MYDALYFPIHRAKKGEIIGAGHLSPKARTRVRPTFEVQKPDDDSDESLEEYLARVAKDLSDAWDHRLPLFVDMPHFAPDVRTADGKHCVEFLFRCLRQHGMAAIPMTGPEIVRGPGYDYLDAIASIARTDGRGAAIRLPVEQFNAQPKLELALEDVLRVLATDPGSTDLFLDLEAIIFLPEQYRSAEGLVSLLIEPLRYVTERSFRNVVICGSCIPERVDKRYNGGAMRVPRIDLKAWKLLVEMFPRTVIKRGDSGVIFALEQDANGPVRPPARIRLSTANDYVLWRAPRGEYESLSEMAVKSADFDAGDASWGATALMQCARFGRGKGGPGEWVARDTNLSVEVTVQAMEAHLLELGRLAGLSFADVEAFAWNQTLIDS